MSSKAQVLLVAFKIVLASGFAAMSFFTTFGMYVLAYEKDLHVYQLLLPTIIAIWVFWGTYLAAEDAWQSIKELRNIAMESDQAQQPLFAINREDTQISGYGTRGLADGSVHTLLVKCNSVLTFAETEDMNSSPIFPNIFVASGDNKDLLDIEGSNGESIGERFFRYALRDRSLRSMRTLTPIPVRFVAREPVIVEADLLLLATAVESSLGTMSGKSCRHDNAQTCR
jgi:hypothetical protein